MFYIVTKFDRRTQETPIAIVEAPSYVHALRAIVKLGNYHVDQSSSKEFETLAKAQAASGLELKTPDQIAAL